MRPEGANYFKREWLNELDHMPRLASRCRSWDKAATEANDDNKFPDFTASIGMGKTREGEIVIYGNYSDNNYDPDTECYGHFRKRPGDRESLILEQAQYDGENTVIVIPEDPGSGGKSEFIQSSRNLIEEGFVVRKDPACTTSGKLKRFEPFSAAAQNGLISIVKSTFPPKTYNYIMKEIEGFDGERSTRIKKDDFADCFATAFNYISQKKNIPIVCRKQQQITTTGSKYLSSL